MPRGVKEWIGYALILIGLASTPITLGAGLVIALVGGFLVFWATDGTFMPTETM